jgi:hypothetical protein
MSFWHAFSVEQGGLYLYFYFYILSGAKPYLDFGFAKIMGSPKWLSGAEAPLSFSLLSLLRLEAFKGLDF